jgi:hypothetical protein
MNVNINFAETRQLNATALPEPGVGFPIPNSFKRSFAVFSSKELTGFSPADFTIIDVKNGILKLQDTAFQGEILENQSLPAHPHCSV